MKLKRKRRWLCAGIAAAMVFTTIQVIAAPHEVLSPAAAAHAAKRADTLASTDETELSAFVADTGVTEDLGTSDIAGESINPEKVYSEKVYPEKAYSYNEISGETELLNLMAADPVKVEAFVTRLYQNFLGREPDPKGLKAWCEVLTEKGGTGASVVKSFVHSKEFQNLDLSDEAYVECFYRVILGREPDQRGMDSWVNILAQGYARDKVLEGFVNSREMSEICEDMGVEPGSFKSTATWDDIVKEFVTRLYRYCLKREPDQPGLDAWTADLKSGKKNGYAVIMGFFGSDELMAKDLSDEEFVTLCYRTILDRDPDQGGLKTWVNKLHRDGMLGVLSGISSSQEFEKLCSKYGISAFGSKVDKELMKYIGINFGTFRTSFGWMTERYGYENGEMEYTDGRVDVVRDEDGTIVLIGIRAACNYTIDGISYGDDLGKTRSILRDKYGAPTDSDEYYEYYLISWDRVIAVSIWSGRVEEVFAYAI